MFEQKSLDRIDGDYFNIIIADSQDVTIQSRNTGHYWYLHCAGYPTEEALVIFHKHRFKDGYHQHGHARSLRQELGGDLYLINGNMTKLQDAGIFAGSGKGKDTGEEVLELEKESDKFGKRTGS